MPASEQHGRSTLRGINTTRPSAARVYDWYLGGAHHWAIDRHFGRRATEIWPAAPVVARHNRHWLGRVVRAALHAGITQFLDLGSGPPTAGTVHEHIQTTRPHAATRVVYVDCNRLALAHSRILLEQQQITCWCGVVEADLRNPAHVMAHPETRRLLDLSQPICVLASSVLHYLPHTDTVPALLADYRCRLAAGSWLAVSHLTSEYAPPAGQHALKDFSAYYEHTGTPLCTRTRSEVRSWFPSQSLLAPGIVPLPDWRPDTPPTSDADTARPYAWCAVSSIGESPGQSTTRTNTPAHRPAGPHGASRRQRRRT